MKSNIAALRIARQLTKCEQGADRLMADTATLVAEMSTARAESSPATGTGSGLFNESFLPNRLFQKPSRD